MVLSGADTGKGGSPVRAYSPNDGLTPSRPAAEAAVSEGQMVSGSAPVGGGQRFRGKDRFSWRRRAARWLGRVGPRLD
jgi:hypothetical protein